MAKKLKEIDFAEKIKQKIETGEIKMRPKVYFILGTISLLFGVSAAFVLAVFAFGLTFFALRAHGPLAHLHIYFLLSNFPHWAPILAILGIGAGIYLLKKYEFSYKQNFMLIIFGFIISIFIAGYMLDHLGLNETFERKGPVHLQRIYQDLRRERIQEESRERQKERKKLLYKQFPHKLD